MAAFNCSRFTDYHYLDIRGSQYAIQIGWVSTGRGQGSINLLNAMVKAIKEGEVNGELSFVMCSREQGEAEGSDWYIRQVQDYGIRLIFVSSKKFMSDLRREGKDKP